MNKIITCIILMITLSVNNVKAKVVRYPMFDRTQTPEFKIDSISLDKNETIIYIHIDNKEGYFDKINIPESTYIIDEKGKKYYLSSLENIARSPETTNIAGKIEWNCILHFPVIKSQSIDFIEKEGDEHSFNIYGINLSKDGEFTGYVNFNEMNRKLNTAYFYFTSGNYEKCIELATPWLVPMRSSLGKTCVLDILGKLIDSHVMLGRKNDIYKQYISEYEDVGSIVTGQKLEHFNCSMELKVELNQTANTIFELENQNRLDEALMLMSEYYPKVELIYDQNDTILTIEKLHYFVLYRQKGDGENAILWGQKALDGYKQQNSTSSVYLDLLQNMAYLYENSEKFEKAEECFASLYKLQEALGIIYDSKHAQIGYQWGSMLNQKCNNPRATQILENAYRLYDSQEMTPDDIFYSLTNALSLIYYKKNNVDQSIKVWEHTIQVIRNRIGKNNALYFNSIVELAERERMSGRIGQSSETIYEIDKEIKSLDLNIEYINGLNTYANILRDVGEYEKALNMYRKSDEIFIENNLTNDIDYAYLLSDMAELYQYTSDTINCINTCKRIIDGAYDTHKLKVLGTVKVSPLFLKLGTKLTLSNMYVIKDPVYSAKLANEIINYKEKEGDDAENINSLKDVAFSRIAYLYKLYQENTTIKEIYDNLVSNNLLNVTDETLEKEILGDFGRFLRLSLENGHDENFINEIRDLVHEDGLSSLLEIYKERIFSNIIFLMEEQRESYLNSSHEYKFFEPMQYALAGELSKKKELYGVAYDCILMKKAILLATSLGIKEIAYQSNDPKLIEQYETYQEKIYDHDRETIEQYEREIIKKTRNFGDFSNSLRTNWKDIRNALKDNEVALEFFVASTNAGNGYGVLALRNNWETPKFMSLDLVEAAIEKFGFDRMSLVWEWLMDEGYVKKGDNVFMSGAGVFQTKYFEHLKIKSGMYFSDICNVIRITSTREIVRQRSTSHPTDGSIILFGGLDYDSYDVDEGNSILTDIQLFRGEGDERYRAGFEKLIYSKKEVDAIYNIIKSYKLKCREYSGKNGTEQEVRNVSGENLRVLHFATHGLYYPNSNPHAIEDSPYGQLFRNNDCMNRSFLVMSGGNALPQHKHVIDSKHDGLLTAKEISQLNLHNVNLVVLSACQSAKGDLSNEGVLGLQYGFKKAGVNSLLMCLDNADDKAAQILMVEFYKNYLSGKSKQESLRNAQKYLRTTEGGKYSDPKYWAPFILLDALD